MSGPPDPSVAGGAPIRFSVVTPSFNQAQFIRATILSVMEQQVEGVEHIVADGASTDGTVEILREYPHLRWLSEPDRGQTHALNKAIAMARGEWIVWINSDDTLLPGALRRLAEFLEKRPDAQFIYSDCVFIDEEGRRIGERKASFRKENLLEPWKAAGVGLAQPGSFFRRSLWERFGPFDEGLHYTMDFDFWLKIRDAVQFDYLPGDFATYRLHGAAKTSEGWRPFTREHMALLRGYWDRRGGWRKWLWRARMRLVYGDQVMREGLRAWEAGDRGRAWRLLVAGYVRNPFCVLSRPHLCFCLRGLVGRRIYERLRRLKK